MHRGHTKLMHQDISLRRRGRYSSILVKAAGCKTCEKNVVLWSSENRCVLACMKRPDHHEMPVPMLRQHQHIAQILRGWL